MFGHAPSGKSSNMDVFINQMAAHGYEGQPVLTDSAEFGLSARRRRLYVFLVRVEANPLLSFQYRSVDCIFSTFSALLSGCLRSGPCASEILLGDNDPAVASELLVKQERREELAQAKPVAADWPDQHMRMAAALRVKWGQGAQPELLKNPWYATLTDREQDAVPLLQAQLPATLMRDLSQSISRANAATWKAEDNKHLAPTMLPKMNVWLEPAGHRKVARLMLGREGLLFQGFPALLFLEMLDAFQAASSAAGVVNHGAQHSGSKSGPKKSKKQSGERTDFRPKDLLRTWRPTEVLMQDVAGNAMSLPVVMTMLQCAFASVNWRSGAVSRAADAPVSTQEDWRDAMCSVFWAAFLLLGTCVYPFIYLYL